jgi:hypothetical protein
MISVAVLFAITIWRLALRNRPDETRLPVIRYLINSLDNSIVLWPVVILLPLAALFLAMAVSGILGDSVVSSPESPNNTLYVSVAMVLWMTQLAASSIYAIVRHTQLKKST